MTLLLKPRIHDLAGGLQVRRLLPAAAQRSVGPFVFFDHFGPVELPAEVDSDVGPHPHIGLATVTYLFEGRMLHRDSLGTVQEIAPGAVNWMTAGRGIVHSERTPDDQRGRARRLHGLQLWVGLPADQEQCAPAFQHVEAAAIPETEPQPGLRVRVLVGAAFGQVSPVRTATPTLYLDLALDAGARVELPPLAEQLALYLPAGEARLDGTTLPAQQLIVLDAGRAALLEADAPLRCVLIGGAALPKPPAMWWNFVASERALIEAAAERWQADAFDPIPGEHDRIAMPPWRR
ncbi:pirin family protein [Aquincola sp. S2]|uniref:Pirin family protein n=1 Tax=Pseudaquabacterium terrae TaxID=2732868 RepID=A0ABX2EHL3_9BURK|nr:pirin family protein [Aquabacterium terrae]NRF68108.1 pirin family protein [Aquabacterium terrae]